MVYVLDKNGHPLMPTERYGKVRRMLKEDKAKVVKRCPFTIKLLYETTENNTQELTLGVDAGYKHIGVSVTSKTKEVYASEIELRTDIINNLSTRREFRKARRNRKTRYRKPKFNNRTSSKPKGWLAPSVQTKINSHLKVIEDIHRILPINKIIIEVASFDIQKIKNPKIQGKEYQQGEQLDFWNVREYVLFRDNHTCQCCKGKSKDKILNVHHIESRKTGGNAPNNLITVCESCHKQIHEEKITLPENVQRGKKFNDATFMGVMRWKIYEKLKENYPNVKLTYGYKTKNTRIENNLEKTHIVDARCITENPKVEPCQNIFYMKKVRNHNRQLHKATINKGGYRKLNQAPKELFGFQLFDKVLYNNIECFIFARRSSGYFDIRKLDGTKIRPSVSYKKLKKLEMRKTYLTERRNSATITTLTKT